MQFELTDDVFLIKSIACDPSIYKFLHDDEGPSPEDWTPAIHPLIKYVLVIDDESVIGIFIINMHSSVCWELHQGFLPKVRGKQAIQAALEFREWIWKYSNCNRLIGNIIKSNKAAIWFAKRCGMTVFGINEKSFMRNGIIQDQVMVGVTRPEVN